MKDETKSTLINRKGKDKVNASESSCSDNDDMHHVGTDVHAELAQGETYEGEKFLVPRTADTVDAFIKPKDTNVTTMLALLPLLFVAYLYFKVEVNVGFNIAFFFFWRLCYNGGLGYLLNVQSKYKLLTKWYIKYTTDANSLVARILRRFTIANLPEGKSPADFPPAFNAWVVYKGLVNFVLVNDSFNYLCLSIRTFSLPDSIDLLTILQYLLGILLFAFNWWAKVDAHRCIGTYCWYWGDFFYRKNVSLTFDGIFELFPHPMYTVGYSVYYGISLICRSYTMLFVSIIAHMSQLVFLVLVEEPHIKRTYGDSFLASDQDPSRSKQLYDAQEGWFPSKADLVYFFSFDLYNSGTWALVMGTLYVFAVALLPASPTWSVVQVVLWRIVHWGGIGLILWLQSTQQLWTRHFMRRGRSLHEAFAHWKQVFNLSITINVAVFLACAIRHIEFSWGVLLSPSFLARSAVATALAAISLWTSYSTYKSVGDFGWFYGDFFIGPDRYQHQLCYTGIYRFLNNPDAMTGYAGLYGLALLSQTWTVFVLAFMSQIMQMLFVNVVEIPHMKKLYDAKQFRLEGPLRRKIKSLLKTTLPDIPDAVKDQNDKLIKEMRKVRTKATIEVFDLYKKLSNLRKKERESKTAAAMSPQNATGSSSTTSSSSKASAASAGARSLGEEQFARPDNTTISAPAVCAIGHPLVISYQTHENHADTDWIGVYAVDVPSVPGLSDGKWVYVPPGPKGTITIKPWLLPRSDGVYELRYHTNNAYDVVYARPILFTVESSAESHAEMESLMSPKEDK